MRRWYGQFLGFIAGWLLLRHPVGGFLGLLVGYAFDHDWFSPPRLGEKRRPRAQDQQADASGNADVDWAYRVFDLPDTAAQSEINQVIKELEADKEQLFKQVGQLSYELSWLKKKSGLEL